MIKLNRTTEYGLMALRHMSRKQTTSEENAQNVTSAREVADFYGLPFEITAKTLQRLKDTGLIQSAQGARGGYTLKRALEEVTLAEFLELMEGPQSVVACCGPAFEAEAASVSAEESADPCAYSRRCEIKHMLTGLNAKVQNFLTTIRLSELTGEQDIPQRTYYAGSFNSGPDNPVAGFAAKG